MWTTTSDLHVDVHKLQHKPGRWVRFDAPVLASSCINVGPPIAMLRQTLFQIRSPMTDNFAPALISVINRLLWRGVVFDIPITTDAGVQDFIGPVEILKGA